MARTLPFDYSFILASLLDDKITIGDNEIAEYFCVDDIIANRIIIEDVRATDQAGRSYIVEMQVTSLEVFDKRVLHYFAKSYSDQLLKNSQNVTLFYEYMKIARKQLNRFLFGSFMLNTMFRSRPCNV
ncbi:MAG: PD-(D/E)XK nuclease family transposase [Verrucomicrobia bacterium]|nr:PD-(D/E)XK nuclease family transposase [Cytophagales bacterium]